MKISEKLVALGITSEDQTVIETAITDLITEAVAAKEVEFKDKYELISEEYVKTELAKKEDDLKTSLDEGNDEWRKEVEVGLIDKLDQFLDSQIDEKISDSLLEDTAYLKIAKPIVESIKKTYEDNHIAIDSEGSVILKEAKEEIESLKDQLSESINKNMESDKLAELGAVKLKISESIVGLSDDDANKVRNLFEDKSFDEVNSKLDNYISILSEEKLKEENADGKDELNETTILNSDEDTTIEDTKVTKNSMIDDADAFMG